MAGYFWDKEDKFYPRTIPILSFIAHTSSEREEPVAFFPWKVDNFRGVKKGLVTFGTKIPDKENRLRVRVTCHEGVLLDVAVSDDGIHSFELDKLPEEDTLISVEIACTGRYETMQCGDFIINSCRKSPSIFSLVLDLA